MVYCQAFGCCNSSGKTSGISYHRFPDPIKRSEVYKQWVTALKVEKFLNTNYKLDRKNDVVCSAHFQDSDYEVDMRAKLMGAGGKEQRQSLRILKEKAIPSVFSNRPLPKSRESTENMIREAEARQVRH